ncbi:MAG: carbonic anhydrase [Alphaproteobacteria bacterium]|nr:carbonic anhydrase [Alphaproteobacteria bacterium]
MAKNIEDLIKGYQMFKENYFDGTSSAFENLVRLGQQPKILMIACSDSRVDPAIITNCEPGDLFVIRNVANLVPPYQADDSLHGTSAALEFAICNLKVHHIIVFGHSQCAGIQSLLDHAITPYLSYSFITKWMELAQPACDQTYLQHAEANPEAKNHFCGKYAIINSLKNLMTFPWIKENVQKNNLIIHGWFFDLSTGIINAYNDKIDQFEEL